MIHFINRDFVVITSSLVYSLKGLRIRKAINDFRKLFSEINGYRNKSKLFRSLYWKILIFYIFVFLAIIGYVLNLHRAHKNGLKTAMAVLVAEIYTEVLYVSTDFYILFFTNYLVIIQKSFIENLQSLHYKSITANNVLWVKSKFDAIQSLIDKISRLLSPILLFVCLSILYDSVTCLYTTIISLEKSYFFSTKYLAGNIGIFGFLLRLIIICLSAESVIIQVTVSLFFSLNLLYMKYFLKNRKIFEEIEKLNVFVDERAERKV